MRYNKLIMFCDYGLDDAIATLHILHNADMFGSVDVVPIGGNVTVERAYKNAHTLLAAAGADKAKVRIVDTRAIAQPHADIPDIHGSDGIGDLLSERASELEVIGFDALKAELEVGATPDKDCVLSLGPCLVPKLLGYVPFCTVLMGGTVDEPPNYGEYEFNEGMAVGEFKWLAERAAAVATLDSCHDKALAFDTFSMDGALGNAMVEKYKALCRARSAPVAVYDYVAAIAVTNPERFDVLRVKRRDGTVFNQLKIIDA